MPVRVFGLPTLAVRGHTVVNARANLGIVPRGADPEDAELFAAKWIPVLRTATDELSWLLSRGYAEASALALVGNRHALRRRQRDAVRRSACADAARDRRRASRVDGPVRALAIDGFNCLITLEAALAGAPIFRGRDGVLRDVASVHGSWREVATTERALALLADAIAALGATEIRWLLDRPVSQSGRLAQTIDALGRTLALPWRTELLFDPDKHLRETDEVVASADAGVLDECSAWIDLLGLALGDREAWVIDLGG